MNLGLSEKSSESFANLMNTAVGNEVTGCEKVKKAPKKKDPDEGGDPPVAEPQTCKEHGK